MTSPFLSLAARAEVGGDDALSLDIWKALGWDYGGSGGRHRGEFWLSPVGPSGNSWDRSEVTGPRLDVSRSIDAQAQLPGRIIIVSATPDGFIAEADTDDRDAEGQAPTEPLARLAALLRAMAATEGAT